MKNENFLGFDGIDWDLEGDDDGVYDTLNPTVFEIVGEMSQVSNTFREYLLVYRNFFIVLIDCDHISLRFKMKQILVYFQY